MTSDKPAQPKPSTAKSTQTSPAPRPTGGPGTRVKGDMAPGTYKTR